MTSRARILSPGHDLRMNRFVRITSTFKRNCTFSLIYLLLGASITRCYSVMLLIEGKGLFINTERVI